MATQFRTAYQTIPRVQVNFENSEKLTESNHMKACDINGIVSRYQKSGVLEHRNEHRGTYGFASSQTFQDAMLIVAQGNQLFQELPAHIRDKFKHDPALFLDFVQDESNAPELVKLGLASNLDDIASKTPQITREEILTALQGVPSTGKSKESADSEAA